MAEFSVIGKRVPRLDGREKATGAAVYGVDVTLPRLLAGKVLRSPLPHARILNIDISKAKRVRGVKAVVTGQDSPKLKFGFWKDWNPIYADRQFLKCDKVQCVGDEVAAVAAIDEEVAEEALGLMGAVKTLDWGVNDLGGTLYEENISRLAGASHGSLITTAQFREAIVKAGKIPRQRDTLYNPLA